MRAFKNGAWVTQGVGTVNGASSASPTFLVPSLNFAQDKEGEAPSIDFAGAGRTVPWATWYEDDTAPFGHKEIFASRFDQATQTWVFAGSGADRDGRPPVPEHRRRAGRREPAGGGRNHRGRRQPRAVDHVAGEGPHQGPDLRGQADRAGNRHVSRRHEAGRRQPGRGLLLAAGGGGALAPASRPSTSIRAATGSSRTSPSPARATPCRGWSGTSRAPGRFGVRNERVFAAKAVTAGAVSGSSTAASSGTRWAGARRLPCRSTPPCPGPGRASPPRRPRTSAR